MINFLKILSFSFTFLICLVDVSSAAKDKIILQPVLNLLLNPGDPKFVDHFTEEWLNGKNFFNVSYFCNPINFECQWEGYGIKFLNGIWYGGQFTDEVSEYEALSTYNVANGILFMEKPTEDDFGGYLKIMGSTEDYLHICDVYTEPEIANCTIESAKTYWFTEKEKAQAFFESKV